jgi:hypothetical protein
VNPGCLTGGDWPPHAPLWNVHASLDPEGQTMPPNTSAAHPATGYDPRTDHTMTPRTHHGPGTLRVPVISGVLFGVLMAAASLAFWWLPGATVYSLGLT